MCHISEIEDLIALYDEKQKIKAKDAKPLSDAEVIAYLDVIEQFRGAL